MYAYPCNLMCSGCGHVAFTLPRPDFVPGEAITFKASCMNRPCPEYGIIYEVPVILVPGRKIA